MRARLQREAEAARAEAAAARAELAAARDDAAGARAQLRDAEEALMQQQGLQRSALTALETEMEAAAERAAHEAAEAQARVAALQAETEVAVRRAEAAEAQLVEMRQAAEAQAEGRMVAGADTRVKGIAAAEGGLGGTRVGKRGHRRSSTDEGSVVAALRQLRRQEDTSSPLGGRSRISPAVSRDMSPLSSRDRLDDLARGVVHAQRDAAGEFELGAAELLRSSPDRHGSVEATAAAEARATHAEAALSAAREEQAAVRAEAAEAVAAAAAAAAAANERAESAEVPACPQVDQGPCLLCGPCSPATPSRRRAHRWLTI